MWWLWITVALADPAFNPYGAPTTALGTTDPFAWELRPAPQKPGVAGKVTLRLVVPPGFVVYRDQIEVVVDSASGVTAGPAVIPPGELKDDPTNPGFPREQYATDVWVTLPVTLPAAATTAGELRLTLRHQGCKDSLCYPPAERQERLFVPVATK